MWAKTPTQREDPSRPFSTSASLTPLSETKCLLKGACDGGLYIPHSTTRFPGNYKDGENHKYDAKVHRDRIFGVHVDNYMKTLKDESKEAYLS